MPLPDEGRHAFPPIPRDEAEPEDPAPGRGSPAGRLSRACLTACSGRVRPRPPVGPTPVCEEGEEVSRPRDDPKAAPDAVGRRRFARKDGPAEPPPPSPPTEPQAPRRAPSRAAGAGRAPGRQYQAKAAPWIPTTAAQTQAWASGA